MEDHRNAILEALQHSDDLPTLPTVVLEVTRLLEDPSSTAGKVTEVIKGDQVLTSRILKVVNSAYYAIPGKVSSVERAIVFLGYNTIVQLLLGVGVAQFSHLGGLKGVDLREFWKHALGVAVTAETIARRIGYHSPEEAFSAGLLHDVGKLALNKLSGKRFEAAIEEALKKGIPLRQCEREQGLPTHDLVGNVLASRWRFPPGLIAAINGHHQSFIVRSQIIHPDHQPLVDIVILANVLCRRHGIGSGGDTAIPDIEKGLLERLGISRIDLPQIKGEMTRRVADARILLDLLGGNL